MSRTERPLLSAEERFRLLAESAEQALSVSDTSDAVRRLLDLACGQTGLEAALYWASDPSNGGVRLVAFYGLPEETVRPIADGLASAAAAFESDITILSGIRQSDDPRFAFLKSYGVRVLFCQTLTAAGRRIGLLVFVSLSQDAFEPATIALLKALGHCMGLAWERARAAQQEAALKEKDEQFRDIHHRVKNNMQVICSLLDLQAGSTDDPKVVALLDDSQSRIRTMALIYEQLYLSEGLSRIGMQDYLQNLVGQIGRSQLMAPPPEIALDAERIALSLDRAIPCGLIVNELTRNALEHAFPGRPPGQIRVSFRLHAPGQATLEVNDDGIGLPSDFDIREIDSLGLSLVQELTSQLGGILSVRSGQGTAFAVHFPLEAPPSKKARP